MGVMDGFEREAWRDDRPSVYWDEGIERWVYRASALGGCLQALVAWRMGMEGDPAPGWMQERFDEGTASEDPIIERFCAGSDVEGSVGKWELMDPADYEGVDLTEDLGPYVKAGEGQWLVEVPVGKTALIRGHLDGIGRLVKVTDEVGARRAGLKVGDLAGIEAKAFGPSYLAKFRSKGIDPFYQYVVQVSTYAGALGLPFNFVVGEKRYEGEGDERKFIGIGGVQVMLLDEPPIAMGGVKARVLKAEKLGSKRELPDCDTRQYPCPFFSTFGCDEQARDKKAEAETINLADGGFDAADVAEIERLVRVYRTTQDALAGHEKTKKRVKKELTALFDKLGVKGKKLAVGDYLVEDVVRQVPEQTVTRKAYEQRYPQIKERK